MWYAGGAAYWANTADTNDGVLGGYGSVHDADTEDSIKFAKRCGVPPSQRTRRTLGQATPRKHHEEHCGPLL